MKEQKSEQFPLEEFKKLTKPSREWKKCRLVNQTNRSLQVPVEYFQLYTNTATLKILLHNNIALGPAVAIIKWLNHRR